MPQGHRSPGNLVAEVKMSRLLHDGPFLIVEGKDDIRFWRARCHANCELINGEGKPNVVGSIQEIDSANIAGALGIVDSDYDHVTATYFKSDNLLYTDAHDMECLLCRSSALDNVLAEHGDRAKIRRFENAGGVDVRVALLERALVFGRLRLAAQLAQPVIALRVKIPRFMDEQTWSVDEATLLRQAVPDSPIDAKAMVGRVGRLSVADPWHVARGKDMIEILRIGLRHVLGDLPARVTTEDIAGLLRAGMSREDLRSTGLGTGLRTWASANRPYVVLAD